MKPLCFVLMPFGRKSAGGRSLIDFDLVYEQVIKPAILKAGLEPLRADEEVGGGIIHKPMFERLVLCDYAIADLTTANANVFYELGVRHAAKQRTTVLMFAEGHGRLPFDVAQLRAYPYSIGRGGRPDQADRDIEALAGKLQEAQNTADKDSPLYQLLDDYPDIDHTKTDVFRDRVAFEQDIKSRLAAARRVGADDIRVVESDLVPLSTASASSVVDLLLSFRAVSAWDDMIRVVGAMDPVLKKTALAREQLGFALNRARRMDEAIEVLEALISERGPSSETNGILGRVFKDKWQQAAAIGNQPLAKGWLNRAINAYVEGFEDDWRDAYPGVNAITLLKIAGRNGEYERLRPIVGYAVERRLAEGEVDYWDRATLLEIAVLDGDRPRCLIPGFDGAIFSTSWKEALWVRFYTGAPRRQRQSVERYNIVKRA